MTDRELSTIRPDVVDCHVHTGPVRYVPVAGLLDAMRDAGVSRSVLVQYTGGDNRYLADAVAAGPRRFAAAMGIDPTRRDAASDIDRWADTGAFRGIRLFADALPDSIPLWRYAAGRGLVVVSSFARASVETVVDQVVERIGEAPATTFVLTRLGLGSRIPVTTSTVDALEELSALPNVVAELTPVRQELLDPAGMTGPGLFRSVIDMFGADRVVFGSGFPAHRQGVAEPDALQRYRDGVGLVRDRLGLPDAQRDLILNGTATRLWFE